jgi:hemerythrin-like metal-binding protein
MSLIKWDDSYSVHIKKIDEQHQILVRLVNELHDAMAKGAARNVLSEVLNSLVSYTVIHFKAEEDLFAEYQYAETDKHTAEHNKLTQQVKEFQEKFHQGKSSITYELMNFLSDWLINHILGSDKKYATYLNSKGVH